MGVDLIPGERADPVEARELSPTQPTLARLSAEVTMPVAGGDTAAASHAILQRLKDLS